MKIYLMLDVGGTNIKAAVLSEDGGLWENGIISFDAKSKGSREEIFQNFAGILDALVEKLPEKEIQIEGIGMAFPGPFDYEQGISLMRGLDKYDAIYGISIAKDCAKVMYLCMGTGAGSAFTRDRKILKGEDGTVPANGWIFETPFLESMIDDHLSVRGLAALSKRAFGEAKSGKELYRLCEKQDQTALAVYREFGSWLKAAMLPFLHTFKPDGFVLGGQLSKSFCYYGEAFQEACEKSGVEIYLTQDTSRRALEGLYVRMVKRW